MTDQIQRPTCAVKGSLHGGRAMCSRVINAEFCGNSEPCEHKVEHKAPEEKKVTLFAHDCTDGMSLIYLNNESFDYVATAKGQREAARIVSCVADCMGMPDELLTQEGFIETSAKLTDVATERDALLAALEDLISVASRCDGWESFPSSALERAQDVIASCKGGDV